LAAAEAITTKHIKKYIHVYERGGQMTRIKAKKHIHKITKKNEGNM
jgi:hypothetical protein